MADKTEVLLHGPVVGAVRTVDSKITVTSRSAEIRGDSVRRLSGDCDPACQWRSFKAVWESRDAESRTMSTRFGGIPHEVNPTAQE